MNDELSLHQQQLDKLVDGELNDAQRRELLASLDREPGGWRRCALAFLEAQCWKNSLRGLDSSAFASRKSVASTGPAVAPANETQAQQIQPSDAARARTPRSPWAGRVETLLAMAASFLVAMWLGSVAQRTWRNEGGPGALAPIGDMARTTTQRPPRVAPVGDGHLAGTRDVTPSDPWRVVTVAAPANGQSVRLPAVERNRLDDRWLRSVAPAMPDDVLQAFNRTGHQVEQRRELVPVPLQDGRRLVVPVDQVDVHYVGSETY